MRTKDPKTRDEALEIAQVFSRLSTVKSTPSDAVWWADFGLGVTRWAVYRSGKGTREEAGRDRMLAVAVLRALSAIATGFELTAEGKETLIRTGHAPYSPEWLFLALGSHEVTADAINACLDCYEDDFLWESTGRWIDTPAFRTSVEFVTALWREANNGNEAARAVMAYARRLLNSADEGLDVVDAARRPLAPNVIYLEDAFFRRR